MRRSAIRSSSIVLIPGSHASRSGGSTDASRLPARAMRSISWAVLRLIIRSSCALCRLGRHRGHDVAADVIDCAHAVDLGNQALAAVVVEHGDGLLKVDLDPRLHRLRLVILPLDQVASIGYAQGRDGRVSALAPVSYTHLRAHETRHDLVCRLLLE